jgi:amino acid transporter
MTEQQALKYSLVLPLIGPTICYLLGWFIDNPIEYLGGIYFVLYMSGVMGCIPYIFLCVGILWWARNRSLKQLKKALLLSPWLLMPLVPVYLVILDVIGREAYTPFWQAVVNQTSYWFNYSRLLGTGCLCLVFGYIYIYLAFAIVRFLKERNYLDVNTTQHSLHRSVAVQRICE